METNSRNVWEIEQRDIVTLLWLLNVQSVGIIYNVMTTRSVHNIIGYIEMDVGGSA
jgi:hypothetical protein